MRVRGELSQTVFVLKKVLVLLRLSGAKLSLVSLAATVIETALGIGVLVSIKILIDVLGLHLGADATNKGLEEAFYYILVGTMVLLSSFAANAAANYLRVAQGLRVSAYVDREIHDRAVKIDLSFYESPKYFDSLHKARQAGTQRPATVINGFLLAIKSAVYVIGATILIVGLEWRILPGIIFALIGVLLVRLRYTKIAFDWQRNRTPLERRASYLDWLITSEYHAKELRLGGLGPFLRDRYHKLRQEINAQQLGIEAKKSWSELSVSAIGSLVFGVSIALLVFEVVSGRQSVGNLILFVLLFRRAEMSGRELVNNVSKLYDDRLYLSQLFDFLSVEPEIMEHKQKKRIPKKIQKGLSLEAVDFSYPGNSDLTLKNINLCLGPGEIVAIVGANGSGKTTLIKVMTRLYDANSGLITLDGTDIREFEPGMYRKLFSVVFQDYAKYAETAALNIQFGDVSINDVGRKRTRVAARLAEAHSFIQKLKEKYDTPLSRMFDGGQEVSVGQWQRLALARAFYTDSKFIVLDEPTSSIDPEAEIKLFKDFKKKIGDRSAVIISHRLTTTLVADRILVLENGEIVENGSHGELMGACGRYASIFQEQKRIFQN